MNYNWLDPLIIAHVLNEQTLYRIQFVSRQPHPREDPDHHSYPRVALQFCEKGAWKLIDPK